MRSDPRLHFEAWLFPVAQALDAVARKGIVHRDVKPTNILFDADGKGTVAALLAAGFLLGRSGGQRATST